MYYKGKSSSTPLGKSKTFGIHFNVVQRTGPSSGHGIERQCPDRYEQCI